MIKQENTMAEMIFRKARPDEIPRILRMQADVFGGEQGIPQEDIGGFLAKEPTCWCAEMDGKIYGAAAAWKENGKIHWGRFAVFPAARGQHVGTRLAERSFDDLFAEGAEEICMDARDATVRIVCAMGGEVAGEPYPFYEGNVTPVLLRREDYRAK